MDFLSTRNDRAIKKELKGIRDSYHHYWDLLAELLQNSRDAITRSRQAGRKGPFFIHVVIDAGQNRIQVMDNGVGIPAEKIQDVLAPGGGDKDGTADEVGEKGVGLTYSIFSGDLFEVMSRVEGDNATGGVVKSARAWLDSESPSVPRPEYTPYDSPSEPMTKQFEGVEYSLASFTRIAVGSVRPPASDRNLFTMTAPQLKFLLRTRTAIGVTTSLYEQDAQSEFDVYYSFKLPGGTTEGKLAANYYAPHLLVADNTRLPLDTVQDAFVQKTEMVARRKVVTGKTVWGRIRVKEANWTVDVYGVMYPDNDAFRKLSRDPLNLTTDANTEDDADALFRSGIFVATKGMPTGMLIGPAPGGRYPAYYKRCFFMVESPMLRFDLGRKSLHYQYVKRLQNAVATLFDKFEAIAPYQGEARATPAAPQLTKAERDTKNAEEWTEARELVDLNEPDIPYAKIPNSQEAAVAALFHEMLGAKVLRGYKTLTTSYGSRYDLRALYVPANASPTTKPQQLVIEFKHDLESLVQDLSETVKYLADIHLLVAWDADDQKLKKNGFQLDVAASPAFEGVTHELTVPIPGIDPIPVILLKNFFDRRKATKVTG